MEFPLKTDFFPQLRLTVEERRRCVRSGEQSAIALRSSMHTLDWKKTMEKDGVAYAQAHCIEENSGVPTSLSETITGNADKSPDQPQASACLMMSATAFAAGTISDVLEAMASPVTENYRRAMRFLHGTRFVDGVCLHTISGASFSSSSDSPSSSSQAFTTIKWAAFDDGKALNTAGSPVGTDYCFLEHSGIYRTDTASGSNADSSEPEICGFSIQESIVREREVPSLAGIGLSRGHFHRTGILILPTDRSDVVQITSILQMRVDEGATLGDISGSGKTAALALARRMRRRVSAVGRLDLFLERQRLNSLEHMPRADWVADDVRKACAVCVKLFTLRRRKHHCRHCGEVVCASCAPTREVDVNTATTATTCIQVRICTACVVKARVVSQQTGGYINNVEYHLRRAGSLPLSQSSTNSTSESATPINNKAGHENRHRPHSLSSGSSSFSISSDSQMSARLARAESCAGVLGLYGYEHAQCDDLSSRSSSSYSLSEFDTFDTLVVLPTSNQGAIEHDQEARDQRRGSGGPALDSISVNSSADVSLLDRIRGMKADLSTLTKSFQHLASSDSATNASSSVDDEDVAVCDTPCGILCTPDGDAPMEDDRARQSDGDGAVDVEFINNSEHFTLLCPETLRRRWRTRTSSHVRQDAGEKSHLGARARASDMSFVSTFSNATMLDDEEEEDAQQLERNEPQEPEHEGIGGGEQRESQAELIALQEQVEGLHRSLAAATFQLNSIHSRRTSRRAQPQADPVIARHQATYGRLVEELHEIMGLPRPGREY